MVLNSRLLVITNQQDISADLVILEAEQRGLGVLRLNTEHLIGARVRLVPGATPHVAFAVGARRFSSDGPFGVWYRRPEAPTHPSWSLAEQRFVAEQWQDFVEGLESLPDVVWMSRPSCIRTAESKLVQLNRARQLGFSIPQTIVTNDRTELDSFRARHRRIVIKPLAGGLVEAPDGDAFIFARELPEAESPEALEFATAPVILQQLIEADTHLRLTVVGDVVLPARVLPPPTVDGIDWRRSTEPPRVEQASVPPFLTERARSLAKSFGLAYCSMDVIQRGPEFYFLDLNPNGEWGWLEGLGGIRVAEHIVDFFASRLSR